MSSVASDPPKRDATEFIQNNRVDDSFNCFTPKTASESFPVRPQVVPLVYIQTPSKLPFSTVPNTNPNNVLVNTVSQLQFATLPTPQNSTITTNLVQSNQSVILTPVKTDGKAPQQLLIHKSAVPTAIVPISGASSSSTKIAGTYLTMIKHVASVGDTNKKSDTTTKIQTNLGQKYVIAPMPKVINNRLPVTVTTNAIQPKFTFMPLAISQNINRENDKRFNIKIANGQIQNEINTTTINNIIEDCDTTQQKISVEHSEQNSNDVVDLSAKSEDCCNNTDSKNKIEKSEWINRELNSKDTTSFRFSKHGISILKKNFPSDKYRNTNLKINTKNSVSDADIELCADNKIMPQQQLQTQTQQQQQQQQNKGERRRKSHFAYRKDYDDMEMYSSENKVNEESLSFKDIFKYDVSLTKLETQDNDGVKENEPNNMLEVEVIKNTTEYPISNNNNNNNDYDLKNILKWEEGIGSLPGSEIKFIINEFNLVEYVTKDEYNKYIEQKFTKINKNQNNYQEDLRCVECGCYGLPSEFITPKYCSLDCQEAGNNKQQKEDLKLKAKKRKKAYTLSKKMQAANVGVKLEHSGSEEDNTSNENSQDKFSYPWTCAKKGFSWPKYLDHIKAKSAPVKLFKDPFPYDRNGFRPGMKLEGIDPYHPSYFCIMTVSEICGYRLRLHFDGYPDNYDFWVNADSIDIFPAGWCEKHGHALQPPAGYGTEPFCWVTYLKQTKSTAAPKHLFAKNRAGNAICPNGFRIGMKLEAVDRKNTSLVCVATVKDMMDNRILIHFDSWDYIYDYWVDPTSPYIHPVGWCEQYGHSLTPPNDYPNPETFTWTKYLKETKSVAVPVRAFKQRPACGFKRSMRLECVDKRVPQLIRVATVDQVRDHQLRIHFDGWPDRYSYWVDDDSEDIHPVGWCHKTGHPLEPPLTPDDVYDFLECPTVGCRGVGHLHGAKYATHSEQQFCPYAEDNIDAERVLPDRLLTPDRLVEAIVPITVEIKEKPKPKLGRPPKFRRVEDQKVEDNYFIKKTRKKYRKHLKIPTAEDKLKAAAFIQLAKAEPAQQESWSKHSQFLQSYVNDCDDIREWTHERVADFLVNLPECKCDISKFKLMKIDGEALLSLSQKDLLDLLHMKMGPAIKLYNVIVLLRQKITHSLFP